MKLKKIVSLALAGVLAVSMLAGCANKPGSSEPTTEPVASDLSTAVIAALDKDTTDEATFTASDALKNALVSFIAQKGISRTVKPTAAQLNAINDDIAATDSLTMPVTVTNKATAEDAAEAVSATVVIDCAQYAGNDAAYVAGKIADEVDAVINAAVGYNVMPKVSGTYTEDNVTYRVNYSYTGEVAVYSASDVVTGQTYYYAVLTLTRAGEIVNF